MNRENMLKVADRITNFPYRHPTFSFGTGKPNAFSMASCCGVACCISGWTAEIFKTGGYVPLVEAQIILGLNQDQAHALFKPPGFAGAKWDGASAAKVLRLIAAAGDGVTGDEIRAFWRDPWA